MVHQLVQMQRFARFEFERGLEGLTDEEARFRPVKADSSRMNCISWTIGHLADQEWRLFVRGTGGAEDNRFERYATGRPAFEPPLNEVLELWREAKANADEWLLTATGEDMERAAEQWFENLGTCVMRNTYHYFFHAGEINAVRQLLGHPEIPFIGLLRGRLEFPLQ
jgi:DinB family protein